MAGGYDVGDEARVTPSRVRVVPRHDGTDNGAAPVGVFIRTWRDHGPRGRSEGTKADKRTSHG